MDQPLGPRGHGFSLASSELVPEIVSQAPLRVSQSQGRGWRAPAGGREERVGLGELVSPEQVASQE